MAVGGCAAAPSPSPERLAECTRLFNTWVRYEQSWTFHHSGQRARAELALYACQQGRYDEGIPELKKILRRGGFVLPD